MEWKSKEGHPMKMRESKKDLREKERKDWQRISNITGSLKNKNNVEQNLGYTSQENFPGVREI